MSDNDTSESEPKSIGKIEVEDAQRDIESINGQEDTDKETTDKREESQSDTTAAIESLEYSPVNTESPASDKCEDAESNERILNVEKRHKPYLGGYRNKLTGAEYHNAIAQTLPPPWKYSCVERFTRDAQTAEVKTEAQQTAYDAWTQVPVRGIYLPTHLDRVIDVTDNYVSADFINLRRLEAVIVIQKYWRRWLAQQELKRLKEAYYQRLLWEKERDWLRHKEEIDWLNEQQRRRLAPYTKEDFMLLFSDLKKWWLGEVEEIERTKSGAELKAALYMVVDKEVERIEVIESKRQRAKQLKITEGQKKYLSLTAAPKLWKASKKIISVETAGTTRGRILHDLYIILSMPKLSTEERIDALMSVKELIKPNDCPLTRNLASLANQEIDLLLRGTKWKYLEGLRFRVRNLYWQYARQPAFNPEALRLSKYQRGDGSVPKIITCSSCSQYYIQSAKSMEDAESCNVLNQRFVKCANCQYLENEGWNRKEYEYYKRILKLLKESEEKMGNKSGLVYLLQAHDICYLVRKIWHSQSVLSGVSILKDLEFARWDLNCDWSPWNCVLLTREEALLHNQLKDTKKLYNETFTKAIYLKHMAGKCYFSRIPRLLPYISEDLKNKK